MQKSLMLMPYEQMVGAFGRRVFKEMRASFFCSRNPDVQNFIHPECSKYEKDFNLSLHSIILGDLTSDLDEKTMSILRGYGKRDARSVGCYLIGQLVRDDSYSHSDISGNEILREVLTRLSYVRNIVGGRFVAIDCVKELIPFYERNGFVAVNQHADLFTMIMPITPLRTMDFTQPRCGRNASQEGGTGGSVLPVPLQPGLVLVSKLDIWFLVVQLLFLCGFNGQCPGLADLFL